MGKRRHIIITGTGRAGTSFLVQYLHGNGIDTHLSRKTEAELDSIANAGLEDFPLPKNLENLPYVIKSPWLSFQPEAHIPDDVQLDAIIIPVRSLQDVATSRVVNEATAMYLSAPWMKDIAAGFEHWGHVPGGVVYSLNPIDQARILAVSFHKIIEYSVKREIPLVLLDFPRFISDSNYLFSRLSHVLPLEEAVALRTHAALADPMKVRVEKLVGGPKADKTGAILEAARARARKVHARQVLASVRAGAGDASVPSPTTETPDGKPRDLSSLSLFSLMRVWYRARTARSGD